MVNHIPASRAFLASPLLVAPAGLGSRMLGNLRELIAAMLANLPLIVNDIMTLRAAFPQLPLAFIILGVFLLPSAQEIAEVIKIRDHPGDPYPDDRAVKDLLKSHRQTGFYCSPASAFQAAPSARSFLSPHKLDYITIKGMSSKIHLLPETLINRIAAGEVVERPASVVKELLENSLDASSGKVVIELEGGGKRLIRVSDDGAGMNPDDALLCLERHATSKIKKDSDLFAIRSLGFRGEALPSIATVSKMLLRTKDAESELGSELRVEGGVIREVRKEAMPNGTVMEARSLFYNLPARREFLKSAETELGHITDLVSRIALSYPEINFELYHHQKSFLLAHSCARFEDRAYQVLGAPLSSQLFRIENTFPRFSPKGSLVISGLISPIDLTFSTSRHLYLYINRRYVRDKILTHSLLEAYRTLIPKNRYPAVIMFLEMPPETVDVNVHPNKLEVRFREPAKIHQAILDLVQPALRAKPQFLIPGLDRPPAHQARVEQAVEKFIQDRHPGKLEPGPVKFSAPKTRIPGTLPQAFPKTPGQAPAKIEPQPLTYSQKPEAFSLLRIIGQFHSNYLILESEDQLIVIDQHAAHERVNFEKLKSQLNHNKISQQILLFPQVVELNFQQAQRLTENLDLVRALGFEIEIFGSLSFIVKSVPYLLQQPNLGPLFADLADELLEVGQSQTLEEKIDHILSVIACHSSVRAGQSLYEPEIKSLLKEMDQAPYVSSCPHGRPSLWKIPLRDLEKKFQR